MVPHLLQALTGLPHCPVYVVGRLVYFRFYLVIIITDFEIVTVVI